MSSNNEGGSNYRVPETSVNLIQKYPQDILGSGNSRPSRTDTKLTLRESRRPGPSFGPLSVAFGPFSFRNLSSISCLQTYWCDPGLFLQNSSKPSFLGKWSSMGFWQPKYSLNAPRALSGFMQMECNSMRPSHEAGGCRGVLVSPLNFLGLLSWASWSWGGSSEYPRFPFNTWAKDSLLSSRGLNAFYRPCEFAFTGYDVITSVMEPESKKWWHRGTQVLVIGINALWGPRKLCNSLFLESMW